jgi:hypothetical protein
MERLHEYDRTFRGSLGRCHGLVGILVPLGKRFEVGSELILTFLNYMQLESGSLEDHSFRFPLMKWNITARYELF